MKRSIFLAGFFIGAFILLAWRSPLCPEGAPQKPPKPKPIEGVWTEVSEENEGEVFSMLPEPMHPNSPGPPVPHLWKISKEKIEKGPNNHLFPLDRFTYQLNSGNKAGAMDLTLLPRNGEKPLKCQAIYFLKDDYLIVCMDRASRPESFTTSSNDKTRCLYVLRRGKVKSQFHAP